MGQNKFRNKKCHCGSGKKYKKCCLYKNQGFVFNEQLNAWEKPDMKLPTQEEMKEIAQGILDRSGKPLKAIMDDKAAITIDESQLQEKS